MLKTILTIGALQGFATLFVVLRSKALAVTLGPANVGLVSVVDQFVQLAAYCCAFNIPMASVKFLSRAHSEGQDQFGRAFAGFFWALLVLSITGAAAAVAAALFLPAWIPREIASSRALLTVALLSIPAMVLGGFFTNVLAAARKSHASSALAAATNSAMLGATLCGVWLGGVFGMYVANFAAGAIVMLVAAAYMARALKLPLRPRRIAGWRDLRCSREVLVFAAIMYATALTFSSSLLAARLAVFNNLGQTAAGLLQAALAIAMALTLVLNPLNGLYLTPLMNRNAPRQEKLHTAALFQRRLILILNLAAMPLALFPDVVLRVLYSSQFLDAAQYLFILVAAHWLLQIAGIYQAILIGFDDLLVYAAITCSGHGLLALCCWMLAPRMGIAGVALGFVASAVFILAAAAARLRIRYEMRLTAATQSFVLYSAAALLAAGAVARTVPGFDAGVVAAKLTVYVAFAASMAWFVRKDEKAPLDALWLKLRAKAAIS